MPDGTIKKKQVAVEWFATKREALVFQAEYWNNPFDPSKKDLTFKEVYEQFILPDVEKLNNSAKKNRKAAYNKCTVLYNMRIRDIKYSHIKALLESYSYQAESTLISLKVLLSEVFRYCMLEGLISRDPTAYQNVSSEKESEKKESYTREEVRFFWDNLDFVIEPNPNGVTAEVKKNPMMDTVLILIYTGMRIDELLNLKTEDIHLEERWIDLTKSKTPAGRRILPIHSLIIPFIEKRMDGKYLLENRGKKMSYKTYKERFFDVMKEMLGFEKDIHETRHTFATFTALCNFNTVMRQKMLGHATGTTTNDVYTHIFIEDLVREIDKLVI